jgi:hypothetical protein
MRKPLLILLSALCFASFAEVVDTTKKTEDSLQITYKTFLTEVQSIRAETKQTVTTLASSLDTNTTRTIDRLKKAEAKILSLENDVKTLHQIDSVVAASKKDLHKKRYELATRSILPGMLRGVVFVRRLSQFVAIEQKVNLTTSPWRDKDLRDGFDKLKDCTPLFGIAGAGLPMLNEKTDPKVALLSGIGAMIVPQLIAWIGKAASKKTRITADKIRSKVEFLNISRNAYDDLYQRKLEISKIYQKDSLLQIELEGLKADIEKYPATTDSLMGLRIFEVEEYINKFTVIQNQIPQYLLWTKEIISKYKTYDEIYAQIKIIGTDIDAFLKDYNKDFNTITDIPFEVRKELFMPND